MTVFDNFDIDVKRCLEKGPNSMDKCPNFKWTHCLVFSIVASSVKV